MHPKKLGRLRYKNIFWVVANYVWEKKFFKNKDTFITVAIKVTFENRTNGSFESVIQLMDSLPFHNLYNDFIQMMSK